MSRGKAITWRGRTFTIDVLKCREQLRAGTMAAKDRQLFDRVLPGLAEELEREPGAIRGSVANAIAGQAAPRVVGRRAARPRVSPGRSEDRG